MTPERWQQIEELYQLVVELPHDERDAHLERVCSGDTELRGEVETLVRSTPVASSSLRHIVDREANRLLTHATTGYVGRRLGHYQVAELIGEGGMGAVFRAHRDDAAFQRVVAIKILHRGLGTTHAAARFRDERQILATLDHPRIVRLLDGGRTDDGLPYLVMDFIEGVPITRFAREHELSPRARVELIAKVCAAVQYAHQQLVVHRDIKPSNVLVEADGQPKLLDFGIAKLLDSDASREAQTRTGVAMLTPEYASPEQARGEPVSTATDVYSIGAVLYELLADRPPQLAQANHFETLRAICEIDPPRPSSVAPKDRRARIAGDLDNIVLKALHKNPSNRYPSVAQLADDLERYLDGRPVLAREGTFTYRAGKFVRRNRGPLTLAAAVTCALAGATIYSVKQANRADAQARRADDNAHRAHIRFDETRKLANSLLFELDDKIGQLRGATAARELVVRRALEYLDGLANDAVGEADLQLELAAAYMKIGDIQGNANAANLGHPRDGLVSYFKALTIVASLIESGHRNPAVRKALGRTVFGIGMLQFSVIDPVSSRATFLGLLEFWRTLPSTEQPEPELLVRTYERLAHVTNDPTELERYTNAALDVARTWASHDSSRDARYWYGITREVSTISAGLNGDPDLAVEHARTAMPIFRELSREFPEDARYAREVALDSVLLASFDAGVNNALIWQPSTGDIEEAERITRESVTVFQQLADRDPDDARIHSDLATVVGALAATIALRDVRAAVPFYDQSLATFSAMLPAFRASPYNQQNEWFTHCAMAEPLAVVGRSADAVVAIDRGLEMARTIGTDIRQNGILQMCQYMTACAEVRLGNLARANELLQAAATDLEAHVGGGTLDKLIGYEDVMQTLSTLHPAQACSFMQRASDAWHGWAGRLTAFVQRRQHAIERDAANACRKTP